MSIVGRARAELSRLRAASLLRHCPTIEGRAGVTYRLDGRPVVGFCSNDYLGYATMTLPATEHATEAGATASRLICGDTPVHRQAEQALAHLCGTEDAVLFPSGFQLNVGVLPCVVADGDVVDSDRLNHASLIDGLRLAAPRPRVLDHGVAPTAASTDADAVHWWVTETVFSMDGDRVDVDAARRHVQRGGALYADEAHALGLFDHGRGLLASHGVDASLSVGTLSKALGCAGAFVAAPAPVCAWIRNRARSFVFSTGVAPVIAKHVATMAERVAGPDGQARRTRVWANARRLAAALDLSEPPSPIFPFVVGDNDLALQIAGALVEAGLHVQAIRPPTVPTGTARLRVPVTAGHTDAQVDELAEQLRRQLSRFDCPIRVSRGIGGAAA